MPQFAPLHSAAFLLAVLLSSTLVAPSDGQAEAKNDNATPSDESFLMEIRANDTKIRRLSQGKPVTGELPYLTYERFFFSVPRREKEGLDFPDVLLSLEVTNSAGNVDIYCNPYITNSLGLSIVPLPYFNLSLWSSNHTQGTDYVWISHRHPAYGTGARAQFTKETGLRQYADFVCALWGWSRSSSEYRLELDLEYSSRTLVPEEREAVRSIHDNCCGGTQKGCSRWNQYEQLVRGTNTTDDVAVLDLCHVLGNVCDDDGHLIKLSMAQFGLKCEFPVEEIQLFSRLEKLDFDHNQLTGNVGEIAAGLQKLFALDYFSAVGNNISGTLNDTKVCRLVRGGLKFLDLDSNELSGPLPPCLFDRSSTLRDIDLDNNVLSSVLPSNFAEDSKIEALSLRRTNLTGSLPNSMENLVNLQMLHLGSNDLTGTIPGSIAVSPYLIGVDLSRNRLTGVVPSSLATSRSLRVLRLRYNSLTGMPGSWNTVGALGRNLLEVDISFNRLEGTIPAALLTGNLTVLHLKGNKLTGSLPVLDNLLVKTFYINLAENGLTGPFPEEWAKIGMFTGEALDPIVNFPILELSNNSLSGPVPDFLLNFTSLPQTVFVNSAVRLRGNDFECVELGENQTIEHLPGLEECESEPEDVVNNEVEDMKPDEEPTGKDMEEPGAPARVGASSREPVEQTQQGSSTVTLNIDTSENDGVGEEQIDGGSKGGSSSSGIVGGVVGGVVGGLSGLVGLAIYLWRRWRSRGQSAVRGSAYNSDDIEIGRKGNMKFEKFDDEQGEVQMYDGTGTEHL